MFLSIIQISILQCELYNDECSDTFLCFFTFDLLFTSRDYQGCVRGRHSNIKPEEPLRPEVTADKGEQKHQSNEEIIYQGPKSAEALERERPRYAHTDTHRFVSIQCQYM